MRAPQTWHHGLIADWWANFNLDAPEVELPALPAKPGARRRVRRRALARPVARGRVRHRRLRRVRRHDDRCRKRAPGATLWMSALHELVPPRRYGSIVASGVFGLGSTRAQDKEAVRRLHDALEPCGTLVLDNEESPWNWRPRDWSQEPERKTTPDGVEFALWSRVDAVDEQDRCVQMTIRAQTSDGRREEHELTMRQVVPRRARATTRAHGFAAVDIKAGADEQHARLRRLPARRSSSSSVVSFSTRDSRLANVRE